MYNFSVDYRAFSASDIIDIHKYLKKKAWHKAIFGLIKKMFFVFLTSLAKPLTIQNMYL